MSFEIAPNATLSEYSMPTAFAKTAKSFYGVERFMHGTNATNGVMVWAPWNSTMTSPSTGQTTWYSSPSNDYSGGVNYGNHKFDFIAYAYDQKRIYTTGLGRIVNTTYPTNKISHASFSQLRESQSVFPNIAFTKCNGSFPTAIRPKGIACTNDGSRIMVIGEDASTSYIMGSTDGGDNWFSMPVPSSLSSLWASIGSVACDGNFFYVLTTSTLAKISASFTSSSTTSDWTQVDFLTSSGATSASGNANLRIFNTDHTTNKLYIFSTTLPGYDNGVFVSTDTVSWTLIKFSQLSPSRLTTYIADISFANRFGNKIVVTANFNQYNNDNRRYLIYTSDLTGATGWTSVEPAGMDRTNYYDITSTCITPDNRYFVFDRLGSVYYTSDLGSSFTKVSTGATESPYDEKVYFIDGSEYTRTSYGNSAYDTVEAPYLSTHYAWDSWKDSDSYADRKWTKQNLTFTSFDDGFSNQNIDIGFTWNYNGSAYTSFKLNTNGQLQFNNYGGEIAVNTAYDRIAANPTDLWLQPGLYNTTNPMPLVASQISTNTVVAVSTLQTTYKIVASNDNGYILFSLYTGAAPICAMQISIAGYYTTSNQFVALDNATGLVDYEGFRVYCGGLSLSQISSFEINYLDSYFNYVMTTMPNSSLTQLAYNNSHGVWTKNIYWVDDLVQHNIFRMVVYCGKYGASSTDSGYRISLYRAGASQKISISALSKFSALHVPKNTTSPWCGPYPAAGTNTTIRAALDWNETTWSSDDGGVTWSLNLKDSTAKSTVVQMGPSLASTLGSSNISLNTTKVYLSANRANRYATTDGWSSNVNSNTFGYPKTYNIKIGPNMYTMLNRYITGERTSSVAGETDLFNAFGSIYGVEINKSTQYFAYGDIDRNGSIDLSDSVDMDRIAKGLGSYGSYSGAGVNILLNYLLSTYSNSFIQIAYNRGWILPNTTSMSSIIGYYGALPGVKNLTTSKTADVRSSHLSQLGPMYNFNVYNKYDNPAPISKSNYVTAVSLRTYKA